ncbi:MAG TPA: hypothetical protein VGC77_08620 [Rhodopseudomonas sp.]|uniref:tetratricopeptide repeat protein n=1 Tax=Rhodopseudomonas sp. TaxID=1078 RepID=UPI002EDA8287
MSTAPARWIASWIRRLRREVSLNEIIKLVSTRLQTADPGNQYHLTFELVLLLEETGRYKEAIRHGDQMIEQFPNDVRFPIIKASSYLYYFANFEEALTCIDFTLQRAYRTGFFRREALGVKARILLQLGRGEQLSKVLNEIMSLEMIEGVPDIGPERDFVDQAPLGLIKEDVLIRYNQFRPKRAE